MNKLSAMNQSQPIKGSQNNGNISFNGIKCQPIAGEGHLLGKNLTGLQTDKFVSSKKSFIDEDFSFASKMKNGVKNIAKNLGL